MSSSQSTSGRANNAADKAQDKANAGFDSAKDNVGAAADKFQEKANQGFDKAQEGANVAAEKTDEAARKTKAKANEVAEETKAKANEAAEKVKQKAREDGIVNPSGAAIGAFALAYIVGVPITSFVSRPNGLLQSVVAGTLKLIPGGVAAGRSIPALSALYIFMTFGASGAISAAGQAMGREEGLDDEEPRRHVNDLSGMPYRLRSAHYGLLENFAGFALAATLAQTLAPTNRQIANLLGLHVLLKTVVYYGSYIGNFPPTRTASHVLATSAVMNVCWRLAGGA